MQGSTKNIQTAVKCKRIVPQGRISHIEKSKYKNIVDQGVTEVKLASQKYVVFAHRVLLILKLEESYL